jgi:hypothetical protein
MTPTILHVGAIRDHQAGYFRRAFRSQASDNYRYLTRAGCGNRAIEVITFRAKAARGQFALAPVGPALTLQRPTRLNIRDDRVDLDTIQRALDPQHDGQSHHYVSIGHQQIVCSDLGITVTVLASTGLHPMSETQ